MALFLLAYFGGMLTILSPCILPVIPFVFSRSTGSFRQNGLPLLLGMALTFAIVALLATWGGQWVIQANQYGRYIALLLFTVFGLSLLWSKLAYRLTQPLVKLGNHLSSRATTNNHSLSSFLLGIATGLLWTPCAGPILGLLLTTSALQGINSHSWLLLFVYALGSASTLGIILLVSNKVFTALKRSLAIEIWLRRILGITVLTAVTTIALGADRGLLTALSLSNTTSLEQLLLNRFHTVTSAPTSHNQTQLASASTTLQTDVPPKNDLPDFSGATTWLNTAPINASSLIGKVVLIDFWTYSCINCLRSLPYVKAWYDKYKDQGLVVIGLHTPEFAFEKIPANVSKAVHDLGITYPVALDNQYLIWQAMNNQYWPAHYFFDSNGQLRHTHFGEGEYAQSEQVIQNLLAERNGQTMHRARNLVEIRAKGVQAAADNSHLRSPETYIGYGFNQGERFVAEGGYAKEENKNYHLNKPLALNEWSLIGHWRARAESAMLLRSGGRIVFRFHARDVHLVLGPTSHQPIRFRVTIDGRAPAANHGIDIDAQGNGVIKEQRLYQLIRQQQADQEHTFEIEFLDPGVEAFSFTFG